MNEVAEVLPHSSSSHNGGAFLTGAGPPQHLETRAGYKAIHVPLYQSALKGDWDSAEKYFELCPDAIHTRVSKGGDTALHIAAAAERTHFVKMIVNKLTIEDLALRNSLGNTALCYVAASGNVQVAQVLLEKDRSLAMIKGSSDMLPIYMAALYGHKEMVRYLYGFTDDAMLDPKDRIGLLVALINASIYDVALEMLKQHPELAVARDSNKETALHVLARMPRLPVRMSNTSQQGFWKQCISIFSGTSFVPDQEALELVKNLWEQALTSLDDSEISALIGKPRRLLFVAAEHGNIEFLGILIRLYPDLIWKVDEDRRSIFHISVLHRHEEIFKLIFEIGSIKNLIATSKDQKENNMLHLAAMLPTPNRLNIVSGAALQFQREFIWFKEVKKVVQPLYAEERNEDGQTPGDVFSKEHKQLRIEGEKWMKETASQCMLVATLIATVVFAAAFTLPGGTRSDSGIPTLLGRVPLKVFAVSDGISLVSSSTSILTFLSILTARYAENDFVLSLPLRLIVGLATLFVSIVAMMVTFSTSYFIGFDKGETWVPVLIVAIGCIPVSWFVLLQRRLFVDVFRSTFMSSSLFHPSKPTLF